MGLLEKLQDEAVTPLTFTLALALCCLHETLWQEEWLNEKCCSETCFHAMLSHPWEVTEILLTALSFITLISVVLEISESSLCTFVNVSLIKYKTYRRDKLKGDHSFPREFSAF